MLPQFEYCLASDHPWSFEHSRKAVAEQSQEIPGKGFASVIPIGQARPGRPKPGLAWPTGVLRRSGL